MKQEQAKVYYQTGNDFLKRRDYPGAISCYKNAISFNPRYYKAFCNLGVTYKNAGMFREAEDAFEKALKLKPFSGVIFNNLGNVYLSTNRLMEAKSFYLKAIRIYPRYKEAWYNLGQVYYFTGEKMKAFEARVVLEKLRAKI